MKKTIVFLLVVMMLFAFACSVNTHKVGKGAQKNESITVRQWYAFYGLAPLNEVDTNAMAGEAQDYEITTQQTFIDGVITYICSGLISARSVTVTK